jgi:hypothetical protein
MMGIEKFESGEQVSDFWSEKISVLIADLGRRAFKMNIDPSTALEAISLCQGSCARWIGQTFGECGTQQPEHKGQAADRFESEAIHSSPIRQYCHKVNSQGDSIIFLG